MVIRLEPKSPIQNALQRLPDDPGAIYEPAILEALRQMRKTNEADFARVRQQAKASKALSMVEFDRLTAPEQKETSQGGIFDEVKAWPDPVNGVDLLDEIVEALGRHVIADKETLRAAALWVVFTWLIDSV